jgi:ubiquinone/menaquinone biosynthesis C-methylase UbiE
VNLSDWHARYQQQAGWTRPLRQHLFAQSNADKAQRILEVGCGTGALLCEMPTGPFTCGLDHDLTALRFAHQVTSATLLTGKAERLPFAASSFDLSFCHFLLLWLPNPFAALCEMRRVTAPGGMILALAEPDYGGRIDYPPSLSALGQLQTQALQQQGANPYIGRSLASLFQRAGLQQVQTGVLGGFWNHQATSSTDELEWLVLREDLQNLCSTTELDALQKTEQEAQQRGERLLYIPTFYALGHVPQT